MEAQRKTENSPTSPRHGWNISEWCDLYGFSRAFYYKLGKQGKAPETISVGGIRLITVEADASWRAKCSTKTA